MSWVEIEGVHINVRYIQTFFWDRGTLFVWQEGVQSPGEWADPGKRLYTKLCHALGVRPCEGEVDFHD